MAESETAKVWLDYTQEELDYNYNQRALVTNWEEYLNYFNTESERVRAKLDGRLDISYGPSEDQILDAVEVHLRGRAERATPADPDLDAPLDGTLDRPCHGTARAERARQDGVPRTSRRNLGTGRRHRCRFLRRPISRRWLLGWLGSYQFGVFAHVLPTNARPAVRAARNSTAPFGMLTL